MKSPITLAVLFSLAVSSSISSSVAHALGVSDAQVGSALNAPLSASIPLVDAGQYSPEELEVRLAPRSAYTSAGLEWSDVIADVSAELQGQPPTIRLTSSQPVNEPWLDVLLVIESPSGSHAHEITLLFDPADYPASDVPARESASQSQSQAQAQISSRQGGESRAGASRHTVNAGMNNPAYVNSGDTLWSVAERLKPDQASVQQMMVALLEANPEVFPSGNINSMRAGFTLNVPRDAQVMRRSAEASAETIEAMNTAWRNRDNGLASVALSEPETASAPEEEATPDAPEQADDGTAGPRIDDAAIVSAEAVNPGEESATLAEQLEESQALLSQLMDEREQMQNELEGLRREVSELTEALAQSSAGSVSSTGSGADSVEVDSGEAESVPPVEAPQRQDIQSQAAQSQNTQSQESEVPASASNGEARGFPSLPELMENYRWTLITAALVLLLILLLLRRRRQAKEWEDVETMPAGASTSAKPQAAVASPAANPQASVPASEAPKAESVSFSAVEEDLETDPFSDPSPTIYAAQESHADRAKSGSTSPASEGRHEAPENRPGFENSSDEPEAYDLGEPLEWEADDDDALERSQAAGLASQRSAASRESSEKEHQAEQAPEAFADDGEKAPAEREEAAETEKEAEEPLTAPPSRESSPSEQNASDSRFIDYQPPSLSAEPAAPREETPMQPTVEFEPVSAAKPAQKTPEPPESSSEKKGHKTSTSDRDSPLGEGWEIEEVAFKAPGRDNARSS
ncbi:FimV/HubP family polar landmark protein [Vreelandella massiliensis]|uniref:FimV/HubP family polar landmark protein n=1 Tax=Vreelandella massiliensis TaxID=1816686 RepID=UPI00096A4A5D|nr:FimV/HubP family polar landmark protein [Halomonas massiliensis]